MNEPVEDGVPLEAFLSAIRTECSSVGESVSEKGSIDTTETLILAENLDAILVGPPGSGKSTLLSALLGEVVCPPNGPRALFPVAITTTAISVSEGTPRTELRVPPTLRTRLAQVQQSRGDPSHAGSGLPQDGVVDSLEDLAGRLESLSNAGIALAEELLTEPQAVEEPIEVVRYVTDATPLQTRWRIIDVPGQTICVDKASELRSWLRERRLRHPRTAVLLCVVGWEQLLSEESERCFAHAIQCHQPRVWFVNKIDSETELRKARLASAEAPWLPSQELLLYVSAAQVLSHCCAQRHFGAGHDGTFLPQLSSPLYSARLQEIELIVKALIPGACCSSPHWDKQYADALQCSWTRFSRSTQFEIDNEAGQATTEGTGDAGAHTNGISTKNRSDNRALRHRVWSILARAKMNLVMHHIGPTLRLSLEEVLARRPAAMRSNNDVDAASLYRDVEQFRDSRRALYQCLWSSAKQDQDSLAQSIVETAERHIQRAVVEVSDMAAKPEVPRQAPLEVDLLGKMNAALEQLEESLIQIQKDWITQGDADLAELCEEFALINPVHLVAEVERQSGVARTFESALFVVLARFQTGAGTQKDWFEQTGAMYLDGLRAAAPSTVSRVMQALQQNVQAALAKVGNQLTQTQWDLAEVELWENRLRRLRSLQCTRVWLLRSDTGVIPAVDLDLKNLDADIWADVQDAAPAHSDPHGTSFAALAASRPEWTWWACQQAQNTSDFRCLLTTDKAPKTEEELADAIRQLVFTHCVGSGWPRSLAEEFVTKLMSQCGRRDSTASQAAALWTSTVQLRGKELAVLVNDALRANTSSVPSPAAGIVLALSPLGLSKASWDRLRDKNSESGSFASEGLAFRGGCLPDAHRSFFCEGQGYHVPMALACCVTGGEGAALAFAQRRAAPADGRPAIIWTVRLIPHREYATTYVLEGPNGLELVFAPYNRFLVEKVVWQAAEVGAPHSVALLAVPDDDAIGEEWPLAPWC